MGLRNTLLFISIIIIGFALSLFFQSGFENKEEQWDQYENFNFGQEKSLTLQGLNADILPYRLDDVIQEIYEKNRLAGEKTRVMEIGSGEGRLLMELKKRFPDVEFYGVTQQKSHDFYRRESYIITGLKYGIFTKSEMQQIELPYVVFQELDFGPKLPYENSKFDLIYSNNFISKIKYKFELLNEVMRVLKPGGVSFHTEVKGLHIYKDGVVLELRDALAEIRRKGIEINTLEDRTSIRFRKTGDLYIFPVTPHQPIPINDQGISQEFRRPEMNYNLN
jgi:ubiquinone/menaquinone biosynthesis C-methylase UbiE